MGPGGPGGATGYPVGGVVSICTASYHNASELSRACFSELSTVSDI